MKYDKLTAAQMAGNGANASTALANTIFKDLDTLATYPINTALQNYHNTAVCVEKMLDILNQAHAAALNQLRVEKPELFKEVDYNTGYHHIQEVLAKKPYMEYEGCKINVSVFADYEHLGRKDMQLGMLNKNIKQTDAAEDKMIARAASIVKTLLGKKEYKKSKPHLVREILQLEGRGFWI